MPERIPQSVAITVPLYAVSTTDNISPLTGATITITISKNTAAFGTSHTAVTTATEIANGWYYFALDATDTNALGPLIIHGTATGMQNIDVSYNVVNANNGGLAALPDTAVSANGSLITSGAGTAQISLTTGRVDLGKILGTTSAGAAGYVGIDWANIDNPTATVALTNTTTSSTAPTVSQIATAVWQDATGSDFTIASSIGKSLYTSGVVPGASGGLFIAGSNAATTVNFTGSLSGSVGSVAGSVGSVTGNVGGNVVGSVASVTGAVGSVTGNVGAVTGNVGGNVTGSVGSVVARVTANTDQWAGGTIPAPNVTGVPLVDLKYTLGTLSPAAPGYVALDWAHITNQSATVNLSNTSIASAGAPTPAQIATAVWQDATGTDFNVASSIGLSLYTGVAPGSANGLFIAGNNAPTNVTLTGTITGTVKNVENVLNPVKVQVATQMPGAARWSVGP